MSEDRGDNTNALAWLVESVVRLCRMGKRLCGLIRHDRKARRQLVAVLAIAVVLLLAFLLGGCTAARPLPEAKHVREILPVRAASARNAPVVTPKERIPTEATLVWEGEKGVVHVR